MTSATTPAGLLTIAQAAEQLGVKPWDVVRLIEQKQLESVVYVDADALRKHQEQQ